MAVALSAVVDVDLQIGRKHIPYLLTGDRPQGDDGLPFRAGQFALIFKPSDSELNPFIYDLRCK